MNRLKKAIRDTNGALVYINGILINDKTHFDAIKQYFKDTQNYEFKEFYDRSSILNQTDIEDFNDYEKLENDINQLGFATIESDENTIYIETITLKNLDVNTFAKAIKNKYPNYNLKDDMEQEIRVD